MPKKLVCHTCGADKNIEYHWVAHSPDTFTPMCVRDHKIEHKNNPSLDIEFPDFKHTTISLRIGTKVRIVKQGKFGENWDIMMNRIMDDYEEYQEVKKTWQGRMISR